MYFATNDVHVPRFPHNRVRGKNKMGLRGEAIAQFDWSVRFRILHMLFLIKLHIQRQIIQLIYGYSSSLSALTFIS